MEYTNIIQYENVVFTVEYLCSDTSYDFPNVLSQFVNAKSMLKWAKSSLTQILLNRIILFIF